MSGTAITGLRELQARFDTFLVDQFGVLHDGTAAYPGAIKALARLKQAGKRVALLSNSGKRAEPNRERMAGLGFDPSLYDDFVSSGEVAWRMLASGAFDLPPGGRVLLIARGGDGSAIEGLDLRRAQAGEDAEMVLIAGSDGDRLTLDDYAAMLRRPAAARTPCLCTNPDKIMLTPSGPRFGAGRIAELYEELGGAVTWIGKPFPAIYRFALERLGEPPRARVVAVGDSVEHDIAGGRAAGLATALVTSGIHAGADGETLAALYRAHGAAPDYLLPGFVWG